MRDKGCEVDSYDLSMFGGKARCVVGVNGGAVVRHFKNVEALMVQKSVESR
jgi:hypothetical protein